MKKIIFGLILLIALTVLFGCTSTNQSNDCKSISDSVKQDECFSKFAIANNDKSQCELINGAAVKEDCFYFVAINTHDENLCTSAGSKWFDCSHYIELYYSRIADTINTGNDGNVFLSIAEIKSKCNDNTCYESYAVSQLDENICYAMPPGMGVNVCIDKLAILKNDPSICEHSSWEQGIWSCKFDVNVAGNKSIQYCDDIIDTNDTRYKNVCYFTLAENLKDANICKNLLNLKSLYRYSYDDCINNVNSK